MFAILVLVVVARAVAATTVAANKTSSRVDADEKRLFRVIQILSSRRGKPPQRREEDEEEEKEGAPAERERERKTRANAHSKHHPFYYARGKREREREKRIVLLRKRFWRTRRERGVAQLSILQEV